MNKLDANMHCIASAEERFAEPDSKVLAVAQEPQRNSTVHVDGVA
jgi:hypothetical protein